MPQEFASAVMIFMLANKVRQYSEFSINLANTSSNKAMPLN